MESKDAALRGLTDEEVAERVADGRVNANTDVKTKSVGQILSEHAFTLFNGVNLAMSVLIFLTGQYRNLLFLCVVLANLVIGVFQEVRAKKMVDDICFVPEVGKLYYGKVVRILPIGAFVEIAPGHDGMVHISKLENRRVEKVEDVLNLGDMTWVKFMGFDEKGRANFSRKDALKEMEGK